MCNYSKIKIDYWKMKYCPLCGNEIEKSEYYQEEDDLHYRGTVTIVECKNCKRVFYHK